MAWAGTPSPCSALAAHGDFLAASVPSAAGGRPAVAVFPAGNRSKPMVVLGGHDLDVTALRFSATSGHLCTASRDHVLLWNLEHFVEDPATGCVVVATDLPDDLAHIEFDPATPRRLAVCCGNEVLLYGAVTSAKPELGFVLRGHRGPTVACARFFAGLPGRDLMVSVGDDRTAAVWGLDSCELLFQSSVLCAAPLRTLAVDANHPRFVVAGDDGDVRVFEVSAARSADTERDPRGVDAGMGAVVTAAVLPDGGGVRAPSKLPLFCRVTHTIHVVKDVGKLLRAGAGTRAPVSSAGLHGGGYTGAPPRVVSRNLKWDGGHDDDAGKADSEEEEETVSPSLLWVQYIAGDPADGGDDEDGPPADFLPPGGDAGVDSQAWRTASKWLLVGTCTHVLLIDAWSYRVAAAVPVATLADNTAGLASAYTLWPATTSFLDATVAVASATACLLAYPTLSELFPHVGRAPAPKPPLGRGLSRGASFSAPDLPVTAARDGKEEEPLTVVYQGTLPADSPLKSEWRGLQRTSSSRARPRGSGAGMNRPVTFHTKIKSSGYGSVAPRKLFGADRGGRSRGRRPSPASASPLLYSYPMDAPPPSEPDMDAVGALGTAPIHAGPVSSVSISHDGRLFASTSADQTAASFRLPLKPRSTFSPHAHVGHTGRVLDASWSRLEAKCADAVLVQKSGVPGRGGKRPSGPGVGTSPLLLTASSDRTARMWFGSRAEAVLVFSGMNYGGGGDASPRKKAPIRASSAGKMAPKPNPAFPADVKQCSFFYMDKFVLLTSASTLALYNYTLDPLADSSNDLRRLRNESKYKLVRAFDMPYHTVTAMTCVTSFLSNLVLLAGSDRSIAVMDLAAGRTARMITDATARPVHTLAMPAASDFAGLSPDAYDLFLTSSQDGGVHLWDLRAMRPIRRFDSHSSRSHKVGASLSPCLRYVAAGSEDRLVYLYDIGSGSCVHRLRGAKDVVTSVCFNPRTPQLFAGCLDGSATAFAAPK